MSLPSGTRIGPYEITAPIGAGGMGEVYRARDARLNRDVAIKTLPASVGDDPNRLARFQREAQALAALSHPNIAAIFGLEESGNSRALVMELVEGPTLAERIAAGPIPLEEALGIARQIGAALEAAHEKGIVHRDLKPANIKIAPDGKVKVLDFGLAKALDSGASGIQTEVANSPTLTLDATRAGVILGTAAYMAPEQARGKAVDKRADIWAFGVVFFEMLTGRSTFEGETVSDTLAGVLRADIDWKQLPEATPLPVRRLLERCLERDPRRRLRDIGDAWIEIDSPQPVAQAPAAPPPPPSRLPWIAAAAALVLAIGGIGWALLRTPTAPARQVFRFSSSPPRPIISVSISRDASRMVFGELSGSTYALAQRMMDQPDYKPIPNTDSSFFPVFSPDGQWIAYASGLDLKLKKIPSSGGSPITLCDISGDSLGITWGEDNTLVIAGAKGLRKVSASGGTPEQITTVDTSKGEAAHRWPQFLPAGRGVLYDALVSGSSQVAVFDLKKRTSRVLVQNGSNPRYTSSGHLIYYRGGTLFAAPFSLSKLEVTGPEAPVVEHVASTMEDGADFSISETGVLVYMAGAAGDRGGNTVLNWADMKGNIQPISEAKQWGTGRLSPDGSHVANSIRSGAGEDIWTLELQRRIPTRLTFEGINYFPVWSPDGKWIAFGGDRGAKHALYRVASDASTKPELLLETDKTPTPSAWTPDGKTLVYDQQGEDRKFRLWSVTLPGGKPVQLHENNLSERNGQLSPDGHWLAYESVESGTQEIYVQPFPGGGAKSRISTQGGQAPRWSHNGKELFYWSNGVDKQLMSVAVQTGPNLRPDLPQVLFKLGAGTTWDPAPDGKRFLVEVNQAANDTGRHLETVVNWLDELSHRIPVK